MGQNKNRKKENTKSANTVEVLYQKMGDRWFAFSLIDDEIFIGSIPQEQIDTPLPNGEIKPNIRELG